MGGATVTRLQDRFAGGGWSLIASGEPVLDDTPGGPRGDHPADAGRLESPGVPAGTRLIGGSGIGDPTDDQTSPLVSHDRVHHQLGAASAL